MIKNEQLKLKIETAADLHKYVFIHLFFIGTFLMAKFKTGRVFGHQATFTSPWFTPIPYYHRNVHSAFYNTCQVRKYTTLSLKIIFMRTKREC